MNTCGNCKFAIKVLNPNDIGTEMHLCYLFPPIPIVIQNHNQAAIVSARPSVQKSDPGCSSFSPRKTEII